MVAHFENNSEELKQIIDKAKRDKIELITQITKSVIFTINFLNGKFYQSSQSNKYFTDMHLISSDGYILFGSTDRMYLPDAITRLYQTLSSLLPANKGHHVSKDAKASAFAGDETRFITEWDFQSWDVDYITNYVTDIYSNITDEIKQNANIEMNLFGDYSLHNLCKTNNLRRTEFDEISLTLNIEISLKSCFHDKIYITKSLQMEKLKEKSLETKDILSEISSNYKQLEKKISFSDYIKKTNSPKKKNK